MNTRSLAPGRQGTVIVERWWEGAASGEGRKPRLHRRHVYKLVEDTNTGPASTWSSSSLQSVDGKARERYFLRLVLFGINFFLPFHYFG